MKGSSGRVGRPAVVSYRPRIMRRLHRKRSEEPRYYWRGIRADGSVDVDIITRLETCSNNTALVCRHTRWAMSLSKKVAADLFASGIIICSRMSLTPEVGLHWGKGENVSPSRCGVSLQSPSPHSATFKPI